MIPLRVTPMNNPLTLISPVQKLGNIFLPLTVYAYLCKFQNAHPENQNANPLNVKLGADFNAK